MATASSESATLPGGFEIGQNQLGGESDLFSYELSNPGWLAGTRLLTRRDYLYDDYEGADDYVQTHTHEQHYRGWT